MLEVTELNTYYGYSHILQGISLTVKAGEVLAVLGRNGVGKTTLVHSIVSFAKPATGQIRLNSEDITGLPTHQIIRKGITLVPQGRRVFRSLSVMENLTIPFRCVSPTKKNSWDLERLFEFFPLCVLDEINEPEISVAVSSRCSQWQGHWSAARCAPR